MSLRNLGKLNDFFVLQKYKAYLLLRAKKISPNSGLKNEGLAKRPANF